MARDATIAGRSAYKGALLMWRWCRTARGKRGAYDTQGWRVDKNRGAAPMKTKEVKAAREGDGFQWDYYLDPAGQHGHTKTAGGPNWFPVSSRVFNHTLHCVAIHPAGRRTGTPAMVAPSGTAIPARPGRSSPNTAAEAKDKERRLRLDSVKSTTVGSSLLVLPCGSLSRPLVALLQPWEPALCGEL